MKIPNNELLQIAAGIKHIILEHESLWSLGQGLEEDRLLSVRFSRPVIKRPLTVAHKRIAVEYAKYRAHNWRVELWLDCIADDGTKYIETSEVKAIEPAKLDDLNDLVKAEWEDMKAAVNPRHIRGQRWRATIVKGHEKKSLTQN